ncbi:hypothetical protein NQZ68_001046 [Dissostichus eleginoides]|nr:hypothetical protein NQZ68_001046 [Dissostichus eleginoides]
MPCQLISQIVEQGEASEGEKVRSDGSLVLCPDWQQYPLPQLSSTGQLAFIRPVHYTPSHLPVPKASKHVKKLPYGVSSRTDPSSGQRSEEKKRKGRKIS